MFQLTRSNGYDRDEIYAWSTDGKGHDDTFRNVKVPPAIMAEVEAMVASRVRDYRTAHDLIRSAIVHQLHYDMTRSYPAAEAVVTAEMRESQMRRYEAKLKQWKAVANNAKEIGFGLLNAGALEELTEFLEIWDQDWENQDLPVVVRKELEVTLGEIRKQWRFAIVKQQREQREQE
jgi:hypothetical protein